MNEDPIALPARRFAGMHLISADAVAQMPIRGAVDALETALRGGLDPEQDTARSRVATQVGELLVMPSTLGTLSGSKLLSITPDNPRHGLPLIQGNFTLFEGPEQRAAALIDGVALTNLRTPAVSALAVRHLLPGGVADPLRLTVFGTGPQARGHAEAMLSLHEIGEVSLVGRDSERRDRLAAHLADTGVPVRVSGPDASAPAVAQADIICCCTSAPAPLFDGTLVRPDAVVVAIGSHSPRMREVDDTLVKRAGVVVESRANALREAGDIVIPLAAGVVREGDLYPLRDVVTGSAQLPTGRPRLFKGTGMAWQDLVVGAQIYRNYLSAHDGAP
ncbi:ornithine cyclodeaminase [Micromonospora rhizosphaerae]|uniref:Ornithine cyclodeaminase n=1 Tax=Micromonospora rhizosphaerae TaxID=568872 RepID=A0A1C6SJ84_9ACTN|nr:ornithine cyclodeaminase family protein [Micromonospora rhizosphaerae]SCL29458.1 ornithine cyclodeaminase [Micromonospora rhizosphaerae]